MLWLECSSQSSVCQLKLSWVLSFLGLLQDIYSWISISEYPIFHRYECSSSDIGLLRIKFLLAQAKAWFHVSLEVCGSGRTCATVGTWYDWGGMVIYIILILSFFLHGNVWSKARFHSIRGITELAAVLLCFWACKDVWVIVGVRGICWWI